MASGIAIHLYRLFPFKIQNSFLKFIFELAYGIVGIHIISLFQFNSLLILCVFHIIHLDPNHLPFPSRLPSTFVTPH